MLIVFTTDPSSRNHISPAKLAIWQEKGDRGIFFEWVHEGYTYVILRDIELYQMIDRKRVVNMQVPESEFDRVRGAVERLDISPSPTIVFCR